MGKETGIFEQAIPCHTGPLLLCCVYFAYISVTLSCIWNNMRKPLRLRLRLRYSQKLNPLDDLSDDLVISILSNLSSTASSPPDFINLLLTCKRLNRLALHPSVLSKLGPKAFSIKPKNWSDSAHRFLKHCVNAGNLDASFALGMIRFYCLGKQRSGLSLMARAAMKSHAAALYSLAVIHFNGSSIVSKDLRAGVFLCKRASLLGHIDALRELGHCLQDGYGARKNVAKGRSMLILAHARELASVIRVVSESSSPSACSLMTWRARRFWNLIIPLLGGCEGSKNNGLVQPVNGFMREWFESGRGCLEEGLTLCAHIGCGRPETRVFEFRSCSVCGKVNYCSRGCQVLDWKLRHRVECSPVVGGDAAVVGGDDGDGVFEVGNHVVA